MEGDVCNATPRKDGDNKVYKIVCQEVHIYRARWQIISLKYSTQSSATIEVSSPPTMPTFILMI